MPLILRTLTASDEDAFFAGLKEWEGHPLSWYTFSWKPGMLYSEMLTILDQEAAGIDLAPDRVPHTMLYAFVDGRIVGRVSIRHQLNDHLFMRGGHIGYAVAPSFRKRGYAIEMVRQALTYCRSLGIDSLLVTCADQNEPSWKVIEKFGGTLESKTWDESAQESIRRYWIKLKL